MNRAACVNTVEPVMARPRPGWIYPFLAIVGQERMKLAPVLNAIEPRIGGVLIRGEIGLRDGKRPSFHSRWPIPWWH